MRLLLILLCIPVLGFTQKKCSLSIYNSGGIDLKNLKVTLSTGYLYREVIMAEKKTIIEDTFNSKKVIIGIQLFDSLSKPVKAYQFYVDTLNAKIILNRIVNTGNGIMLDYELINAYSTENIEKEMELYISKEQMYHDSLLSQGPLTETFFDSFKRLIDKKMEFIKQNKDDYFSFIKFSELSYIKFPASLNAMISHMLPFFRDTFSEDIRLSEEGRVVEKRLIENSFVLEKDMTTPAFSTMDTKGNKITNKTLNGKYYILSFWASWCIPCIKEIPALRKIKETYPEKDLSVISINFDDDSTSFINSINKYKMNWIHIYGDSPLTQKLGLSGRGLPQLFLVNRSGKVLYSKATSKEVDHVELTTLQSILQTELGKKD